MDFWIFPPPSIVGEEEHRGDTGPEYEDTNLHMKKKPNKNPQN